MDLLEKDTLLNVEVAELELLVGVNRAFVRVRASVEVEWDALGWRKEIRLHTQKPLAVHVDQQ